MEDSCEYIDQAVADSRQRVVLQLGRLGEGLKISHIKKKAYYEMLHRASEFSKLLDISG
jgi:hypothetical protein